MAVSKVGANPAGCNYTNIHKMTTQKPKFKKGDTLRYIYSKSDGQNRFGELCKVTDINSSNSYDPQPGYYVIWEDGSVNCRTNKHKSIKESSFELANKLKVLNKELIENNKVYK